MNKFLILLLVSISFSPKGSKQAAVNFMEKQKKLCSFICKDKDLQGTYNSVDYVQIGDSLIYCKNHHTYNAFSFLRKAHQGALLGIRQEGSKVYIISAYSCISDSPVEGILFDFSLSEGDSVVQNHKSTSVVLEKKENSDSGINYSFTMPLRTYLSDVAYRQITRYTVNSRKGLISYDEYIFNEPFSSNGTRRYSGTYHFIRQ